jgi:autophagy-related protein 9
MLRSNNILSRFVNSNPGTRSIYEELREDEDNSEEDVEARAGMMLDEENLGYNDDELGHADMFSGEESQVTTESTAFLGQQPSNRGGKARTARNKSHSRNSKWLSHSPRLIEEEGDDDVPASLLIEGHEIQADMHQGSPKPKSPKGHRGKAPMPTPPSLGRETRAQWEAAQAQQQLHQELPPIGLPHIVQQHGILGTTARDRAMWRWVNVVNLDNFIRDVYAYYQGNGMWCTLLERVLNLL